MQVENWNLERYVNMALDAKWKEDLDFAHINNIRNATRQIRQPMIPIESFNPNCAFRQSFSDKISFRVRSKKSPLFFFAKRSLMQLVGKPTDFVDL